MKQRRNLLESGPVLLMFVAVVILFGCQCESDDSQDPDRGSAMSQELDNEQHKIPKPELNRYRGMGEGDAASAAMGDAMMFAPPRIRPRLIEEGNQGLRVTLRPDSEGTPEGEWDTCVPVNTETSDKSHVEVRLGSITATTNLTQDHCDRLNEGDDVELIVKMPQGSGVKRGSQVDIAVEVWQTEFESGGLIRSYAKETMLIK